MSRKSNRLKNRLRMERERAESEMRKIRELGRQVVEAAEDERDELENKLYEARRSHITLDVQPMQERRSLKVQVFANGVSPDGKPAPFADYRILDVDSLEYDGVGAIDFLGRELAVRILGFAKEHGVRFTRR